MYKSLLEDKLKNNFEKNKSEIKSYLLNAYTKEATYVYYGTFDELWCSAGFIITTKNQYQNELEAFITLYSLNQAVANANTYLPIDYINEIEADWLLCSPSDSKIYNLYTECNRTYLYKIISINELNQELDRIIIPIKQAIYKVRIGERKIEEKYQSYWGIYENGKRVENEQVYKPPIVGNYVKILALCLDWNDSQLWLETESQYVYFNWSTGA